jgi:two-component system, OmpR family, alkaline phosphatase synthesis response regulator PhoP
VDYATDVRKQSECPRVLIVDDDPLTRDVVRAVLEDATYAVEVAVDGMHALDLARERAPDVVLLDVMMPGMNGFQVAEALRRDLVPDCVIIMLTAMDRETDRARGFRAGANAYFTKPFSPLDLLDAVSAALNERVKTLANARRR